MSTKNNDYDFYIIPSSIDCNETEIVAIKKLKTYNKTIFAIGPFAISVPDNYVEAGAKVVSDEPEIFFYNLFLKSSQWKNYQI